MKCGFLARYNHSLLFFENKNPRSNKRNLEKKEKRNKFLFFFLHKLDNQYVLQSKWRAEFSNYFICFSFRNTHHNILQKPQRKTQQLINCPHPNKMNANRSRIKEILHRTHCSTTSAPSPRNTLFPALREIMHSGLIWRITTKRLRFASQISHFAIL